MPAQSGKLGRGVSWRCVSGWYHIRFRDPKKKPREKSFALGTDDYGLAMKRAYEKYEAYRLDTFRPWEDSPERDIPWDRALHLFRKDRSEVVLEKTLSDYCSVTADFFVSTPEAATPRSVTGEQVRRFVYQSHLSQATRASYYRKLRVFFGWCREKGYLETVPLLRKDDKPTAYEPIPKALKKGELERLIRAGELWHEQCPYIYRRDPNELWALIAFEVLAWTGLRPSEGRRLRWQDIHWSTKQKGAIEPGYIHLESRTKKKAKRKTKGGHDGIKTLFPQAERVLKRLYGARSDREELVLRAADGVSPIPIQKLSKRFNFYRDRAKLPDTYTLYSLRHTFAAEYLRRGGSLALLQDEMTHLDSRTTRKYSVLDPRERMEISYRLFEEPTFYTHGKSLARRCMDRRLQRQKEL